MWQVNRQRQMAQFTNMDAGREQGIGGHGLHSVTPEQVQTLILSSKLTNSKKGFKLYFSFSLTAKRIEWLTQISHPRTIWLAGSTTLDHVVGPMKKLESFKIWRMNLVLCYRQFNGFDISIAKKEFFITALGALSWVPPICLRRNYRSIVPIFDWSRVKNKISKNKNLTFLYRLGVSIFRELFRLANYISVFCQGSKWGFDRLLGL